jgi:predicted nucleic acid-binding protein
MLGGKTMKMKKIPKLFIETTVFNFYFEEKHGQKQQDAVRLFEEIAKGKYEAYTSEVVIEELKKASVDKFLKMKALSEKYIKRLLVSSPEMEHIAEIYIEKGIIPAKSKKDALHIACAVVNNLDFMISYNQGHIVKTKTMIGTGLVNLREGYRQIGLSTPTEVIEYDC